MKKSTRLLSLALVLTLLLTLLTGCSSGGDSISTAHPEILSLINTARAKNNNPALTERTSADTYAEELGELWLENASKTQEELAPIVNEYMDATSVNGRRWKFAFLSANPSVTEEALLQTTPGMIKDRDISYVGIYTGNDDDGTIFWVILAY